MLKKSTKNHLSHANLHFSSSLNLEASARLIASLADANHHIDLIEMPPDRINFKINYILNNSDEGKVEGTLKHWNHNETRVECRGKTVPVKNTKLRISWFLSIQAVLFLLAALAVNGYCDGGRFPDAICLQEPLSTLYYLVMMSATVSIFTTLLWFVLVIPLMNISSSPEDEDYEAKLHFRERDRLFRLIIETFKSAGDVQAL